MNEQTLAIKQTDNLHVIAQTPDEMKQANQSLIQWCDSKIRELRVDMIELDAAWKSALAKKWKHSVLKHHAELAKKRIIFYGKMRTALMKGFFIVPNFPVTAFAIRTNRKKPLKMFSTYQGTTHEQHGQPLAEGEGRYENPFPEIWQTDVSSAEDKAKNKKVIQYFAEKWRELDFPITMAKPHIMEAVDRAMALKLFDEFGVIPSPYRKSDPMIIARIRDPRPKGWGEGRSISFIIAWALDTRTL